MAANSIAQQITAAAPSYGVPPALALAQAQQESSLNPNAYNPQSGAIGLFQLEPSTAADLGVNPQDPTQNIHGGLTYLSQLYQQFGDWATALAAYDWGPGNVQKAISSGNPNWLSSAPAETQNYVASVLSNAGMDYSAQLTPGSIASGLVSTVLPSPDSVPVDFSTLPVSLSPAVLILGAVGLYFLARLVFDEG